MTMKYQRSILNCRKRRATRAERLKKPFGFCLAGLQVQVINGSKPGLWTGTIDDKPIGYTSEDSSSVAAFIIAAIHVGQGLRRG